MASGFLSWNSDLKSDTADYYDKTINDKVNQAGKKNNVRSRTTSKDKFTSSIAAYKNYFYDIQVIYPTLQVIAISNPRVNSHNFPQKAMQYTMKSTLSQLMGKYVIEIVDKMVNMNVNTDQVKMVIGLFNDMSKRIQVVKINVEANDYRS